MRNLPAQGALAEGCDPAPQMLEGLLMIDPGVLAAEAVEVAEDPLVDDADQAIQLQQGVLQGSRL